jgi:hypothetical protein
MFAFNPGNEDMSGRILGGAAVGAAQTTADAKVKLTNDIGSALVGLAGMYAGSVEKKDALKGMDTAVMGMSDLGAITPDFRDSYLNADDRTRPFLFQALASPMFQSYNAGQSAAAQAQAWDQYKTKWGSNAGGGGPMPFTY